MNFVVLDVETANADLSSICQVGIASFQDGLLVNTWCSLVNPEDYFDEVYVSIHGINEDQVATSPTWGQILPAISVHLTNRIVVCHTPFDKTAVTRACERAGIGFCDCVWLDSARVTRRAWPQFSRSGYGLSNVASHFGIEYKAHDALEDARCAGEILLLAISDTGLQLEEWLIRVKQGISANGQNGHKQAGNPDGDLYGEVVVFTGALSVTRSQAAEMAATAGCNVNDGITKHTTLLVVGDQDLRKLNGRAKSTKHLKAEQLMAKGQKIRIVGESDFKYMVAGA
ncbi:exonuclease domain-containing protein [Silvibacterium acidisoli]|uniref:exonuclease domain-containing protein n=1 Tax=Acidobacteriaceae bacterium ZG23-2 TaxID=2883246 RepID=UPI00406CFAEA